MAERMEYSDYRNLIRASLYGGAALGPYTAGVLETIRAGSMSFAPVDVIKTLFSTSASMWLAPLSAAVIAGVALRYCQKAWESTRRLDKLGRNFSYAESEQYGGAHFEEPYEYTEIAQIRKLCDCKGKVLGQLTENGKQCVDFNPDNRFNEHMIAIGTSGGGKTWTFVKSFLFQTVKQGRSVVVSDPDGGLYEDMSSFFRDNGYVVRKLDLKNLSKSDGWHVLSSLRHGNLLTNVSVFADTVVSNISNKQDIHSAGAKSLLSALVLRVLLGKDYPEEKKTLASVYDILTNVQGKEGLSKLFDVNTLSEEELPALVPYQSFNAWASENLGGNMASNLANGMGTLQDRLLSEILSTDDIDLTLPGKQRCAYFCQFPDLNSNYQFVIALFFALFFQSLAGYADLETEIRRLDVPVDFLLDEFANIGTIPDWADKVSVLRKRGVNGIMIVQDITQLEKNYPATWRTIVGNCGTLVTLGINEHDRTAEWLAKRIGETSVEVTTSSETEVAGKRRKSMASKTSVGVGKRQLLTAAELVTLSRDSTIIVFSGHFPIIAKKFPHTIFPEAKLISVTKPRDIVDFSDKRGRKLLREAEEAYLAEFWSTHDRNPDLAHDDLSTAMFTQAPGGLLSTTADVVLSDARRLARLFRGRQTGATAGGKTPQSKSCRLAKRGAFNDFYREYLASQIGYDDQSITGGSVYDANAVVADSYADFGFDIFKNEPTAVNANTKTSPATDEPRSSTANATFLGDQSAPAKQKKPGRPRGKSSQKPNEGQTSMFASTDSVMPPLRTGGGCDADSGSV